MLFETALENMRPYAENIIETFRYLQDSPDVVEVEFGMRFTAGFGAVIVSSGAEIVYRVISF